GAAKLIRKFFPDFPVHASTQMTIHNLEGAKFLEEMGIRRVVLAREMEKEEILNVSKNTEIDIEVFVHGALCVSYSGQCLMSSMIGGRSGNRGRCAQPCRMPYDLVDLESKGEVKHSFGKYLLSPRDLNTIQDLDEIVRIGVDSLKIEGRMKRPEYVAIVTNAYRKMLDASFSKSDQNPLDENMLKDLEQIFNRGFTRGYLFGAQGKEWISFSKPSNRGRKIGNALNYDKRKQLVQIQLEDMLSKGDGIEVELERGGTHGGTVDTIRLQGKKVDHAYQGDIVEVFSPFAVKKGTPVYKTSDAQLLQRACASYEKENKKIPIYGQFFGELGREIELLLWDDRGNFVKEIGDFVPVEAVQAPISKERVREQLEKTGNTPYRLEALDIQWEEGLLVPIGKLNQLRRNAIQQLDEARSKFYNRKPVNIQEIEKEISTWLRGRGKRETQENPRVQLRVKVQNMQQLRAALQFPVDRIYYADISTLQEAWELANRHKIELFPSISRIMRDEQIAFVEKQLKDWETMRGILVADLGMVNLLRRYPSFIMITDFNLNGFNNVAVELLREVGAGEVTLSPELTLKQMEEIIQNASVPCEVIIHGHLPLMIMKYCPISTILNSNPHEKSCSFCKKKRFGLKDRKGMVFPLLPDSHCNVEVLNAQKLCMIEHIDALIQSNITNLRIQFTIEDGEEVSRTLRAYMEAVECIFKREKAYSEMGPFIEGIKKEGFTKGHFFRGVE
ncbi:MAG TPA: U32 family peptidase, partial [Clostridiales bacterium]|nr:U32 family peptidase [Clostridiales bacterium]